MIALHANEVLAKLRETIDRHGGDDVHYQQRAKEIGLPNRFDVIDKAGCVYAYNNKPACLIGCLMVDLGLPVSTFDRRLNENVGAFSLFSELTRQGLVETDETTVKALVAAQDAQDRDMTWGEAYTAAQQTLGDLEELASS